MKVCCLTIYRLFGFCKECDSENIQQKLYLNSSGGRAELRNVANPQNPGTKTLLTRMSIDIPITMSVEHRMKDRTAQYSAAVLFLSVLIMASKSN